MADAVAAYSATPRALRGQFLVAWIGILGAGYLRFELERVTQARLIVLALAAFLLWAAFRQARKLSGLILRLPEGRRRDCVRIVRENEEAERARLRASGLVKFLVHRLKLAVPPLMIAYAAILIFVPKFTFGTFSPMLSAMLAALVAAFTFAAWRSVRAWRSVPAT
jgi:hypothetical protein